MWIVRVALNRPYMFVVLALLILGIGPLAIARTPTDIFPNIDIPVVASIWNYGGLSAQDMADRIVSNYERTLTITVNDIEHIESQSLRGIAIVKVFFQVGVATAAFYPIPTLSGAAGFEASSFGSWLAAASNFWSVAPAALVTAFDAGGRRAASDQARPVFAESTATYRETVLSAFQEVEDQLATLKILEDEAAIQANAVAASERSLELATNRYRGGVVSYLEVTTAQSAALANQQAAVNVLIRRMEATVRLIKALGGGWSRARLGQ